MTEKLVTIRNFAYSPDPVSEAELARLKLESAGIPCFLAGKELASVSWLYSGAASGVQLQVRPSDVKRALELLGAEPSREGGEEGEVSVARNWESLACPRCHSDNVEYERFSRKFFYLSLLLLGFPLLWATGRYQCNQCGYTWRKGKRSAREGRADTEEREERGDAGRP